MVFKCLNESGKLGLDLIIGLSIFMVSFIFIAQYIPSVFIVERGETSLQPVAYRTGAILVEDRGYWTNGTANGSEWWNHTDASFRIGLMGEDVNVLSNKRVNKLQKLYNTTNYSLIQKGLGLITPRKSYDYNISLRRFSSYPPQTLHATQNDQPVLSIGKPIPDWTDVAKYERYIVYENATMVSDVSSKVNTPRTEKHSFNVSPPVTAFVIVINAVNDNDTATEPWMEVSFENDMNPKVVDVSGANETVDSFDITEEINQVEPDKVYVKIHNTKGYVVSTKAGDYVGGRIGAKLVVTVW